MQQDQQRQAECFAAAQGHPYFCGPVGLDITGAVYSHVGYSVLSLGIAGVASGIPLLAVGTYQERKTLRLVPSLAPMGALTSQPRPVTLGAGLALDF